MNFVLENEANGILYLTINNPLKHNALDLKIIKNLITLIEKNRKIGEIKALVITGSGNKSFSSGSDLNQLQKKDIKELFYLGLNDLCDLVESLPFPTIAAINGYAIGGGLELALSCDFRIAKAGSLIGLREVRLGLIPSAGATRRLTKLVGPSIAKEIVFTGELLPAKEALDLGIINKVCEEEDILSSTICFINRFIDNAPLAISLAKLNIDNMSSNNVMEKISQAYLLQTKDKEEGINSFLLKKKPNFKGW